MQGQTDPAHWLTYFDAEQGFAISYPAGFRLAKVPIEHIVRGAVVTFIPTANPLTEAFGERTNLIEFSVSIGVTHLSGPRHLGAAPLPAAHLTRGLADQQNEAGGLHFFRSYAVEGAMGNRYETISYCTDYSGRRYEICLFLHTGNPSIYEPGSITVFDPDMLIGLLEAMVRTFFPIGQSAHLG